MRKKILNDDALFLAIVSFKGSNDGNSPTIRHLQKILNYKSSDGVWRGLRSLREKGKIMIINHRIYVVGGNWFYGPR